MAGWFELTTSANGQFRFVLKAGNAETILTSEVYRTKRGAARGIAAVQTYSPRDERYARKQARDGAYYFTLTAANHRVIGTSETYQSSAGRDNGIRSVQTNGATATIKDHT